MNYAIAVNAHRDALRAATKAVEEWSAKEDDDAIASAIIEQLSECATDTTGDDTLEVVSDLFEEHWKKMSNHLAHTLGDLAKAAHALGRAHSPHTER